MQKERNEQRNKLGTMEKTQTNMKTKDRKKKISAKNQNRQSVRGKYTNNRDEERQR